MVHAMEMEKWVWLWYVGIELVLSLVLLHIDTSIQPLLQVCFVILLTPFLKCALIFSPSALSVN